MELDALKQGFESIFPADLSKVLTAKELSFIVGGEKDINLQDWMNHTSYRMINQVKFVIQFLYSTVFH